MKAILIDDEKQNLDNLQALLTAYCPEVLVCGKALNASHARTLVQEHHPDLLFLDIHMPGESGLDLLRSFTQYDFEVIFVTAYDQYALQAMRLSAVDYLLKPIDIAELQAAVHKATQQHRLKKQHLQLENLMQLLQRREPAGDISIALSTTKETHFVKTSEIVCCESSNNYTTFFLTNAESLLVCKPIYEYEELLAAYGFIRCHQSHLVNKQFIKSWKKEDGDFLLLQDGREIPISRGKKEEVKNLLFNR